MKEILNEKKLVFFLGIALIVTGAVNSTMGNVTGGISCFSAGIIIVILFYFDVKSFNVFGMEAELRGKIDEADRVLKKLRGISLPVSAMAVNTASQVGRYDKEVPRKELYDYVCSISKELKGMGVLPEEIEKVKASWYLATALEMAKPIHREIMHRLNTHQSRILTKNQDVRLGKISLRKDEESDFFKLVSDIQVDVHNYQEEAKELNSDYKSYPTYFTKIIKSLKGIPENEKSEMLFRVNEHILDLEYLITTKGIRRPDVWFNNK